MKSSAKAIIIFLLADAFQQASCQIKNDQVAGSWLGILNAGGVQMRLVFNISISEDDAQLEATMDSPDQGAKDIPMGDVMLTGDSLRIEAPMLMGYYNSRLSGVKDSAVILMI